MKNSNLLSIHLAILLVGFGALFARLIPQNALIITFGRVLFSSLFIGAFIWIKKERIQVQAKKDLLFLIITGILLAIHWSSFIYSVQIASIAVGTITFSTFPLYMVFLEPLFFKEKFKTKNLFCAGLILVGVGFIAIHALDAGAAHLVGVIFGLLSGLTYVFITLLNRRYAKHYQPTIILFYEQSTATLILLPVVFFIRPTMEISDVGALLIYGILFTAVSRILFVRGLRTVSGTTASLITSLEPVYAILFSVILIAEFPRWHEVVGGIIIITVAAYVTYQRSNPA